MAWATMAGDNMTVSHHGWGPQWLGGNHALGATMTGGCHGWEPLWLRPPRLIAIWVLQTEISFINFNSIFLQGKGKGLCEAIRSTNNI